MAKLIINFPIAVDAEIESISNADESAFGIDKTDFIRIKSITLPKAMVIPAACVAVAETDEG